VGARRTWDASSASSFSHVDPFEDTERAARGNAARGAIRFTHVDPFEDTESRCKRHGACLS